MSERTYYDPEYFGTWNYWRHPYGLLYTDSIRDFAESHGAFWTIDVVASYMHKLKGFDFLVLWFDVDDKHCAFFAKEDTGMPEVVRQEIPFTDLTVSVKLYLIEGILMFPSDN